MPTRGIEHLVIVGGELCLDFTNTVHHYDKESVNDELASYSHLLNWAAKVGLTDHPTHHSFQQRAQKNPAEAEQCLADIKYIRRAMHHVFSALAQDLPPKRKYLQRVCDFWKTSVKQASFTPSAGGGYWTYHQDCSNLTSLIYPVSSSAMHLLESREIRRVRSCEACDCTWLFVDRSRNRSRRWCQMEVCGNREKAKRHYEKTRSTV